MSDPQFALPKYPGTCLALPSAALNAAKASTEPMLISLMLEVADGHTRLRCATCPLWMATSRVYPRYSTVNSYFVSDESDLRHVSTGNHRALNRWSLIL